MNTFAIESPGRNIVLCFDGTNNQYSRDNTSVVRLIKCLDRDETRQLVYYDPGLGTLPAPGAFSRLQKWLSIIGGLAFGAGLAWKVQQGYRFLMEHWRPGDRVYLFGFSRGAYTARVLAGFLHSIGLLARGNDNLVPYAFDLYANTPDNAREGSAYWTLCNGFRKTFARPLVPGGTHRRFPIHFLGVWDTVSTIGWIWNPRSYPFTTRSNTGIQHLRHAVSIDERRCFFRQNLVNPPDAEGRVEQPAGRDLEDRWFAGVHSDVGGGYPLDQGDLWRRPFEWIVAEARENGLRIDESRLQDILAPANGDEILRLTPHESLKGAWWLGEFFPKFSYRPRWRRRLPTFGLGWNRTIPTDALIDVSALRLLGDPSSRYAPRNITPRFAARARDLPRGATAKRYRPVPDGPE